MLLSIGMIVKNEEKYLNQCLTALQPLLDAVDSELIIADTGSTDGTVEIAKKHTDNVFYFEWTNDFSAARNSTLEKAKGQWYMFLDADEIFQNCDDIIKFFNSGEYRKYNNASYIIRSYTNENDLSSFSDANTIRLAEITPETRFVNAIHEGLYPVSDKVKRLLSIVDHYGYFFRNGTTITDIAYKKSKRNLEPLLKSLESTSYDFSVYKEIADCYQLIDDNETALKYINKGLEVLSHSHLAIAQYYSFKAASLLGSQRYEEVIETCDNYFGKDNPSRKKGKDYATDFDMYAMRAEAKYRLGKQNEAVDDFLMFFKIHNSYEKGRLNTDDLLYNTIKVRGRNIRILYHLFLCACQDSKRYHAAEDIMKRIPISEYMKDAEYMFKLTHTYINIMDNIGYNGLNCFYSQLDDNCKSQTLRILRWRISKSQRKEEIINKIIELTEKDSSNYDVAKIMYSYYIDNTINEDDIRLFIEKHGTIFNVDIFCLMLEQDINISEFISADDFDAKGCIRAVYTDYPDHVHYLEEYDISNLQTTSLRNAASMFGRCLVESDELKKSCIDLLEKYGETASRWKEEFPDEQNIPGDIQAGLIVHSITSAHAAKDYKLCISEMRRLIKVCPEFAPFIKDYQQMIKAEINPVTAQPVQQTPQMTQMEQMAAMVKNNIRTMIAAGDLEKASSTLAELYTLVPTDKELSAIKAEIAQKNQMAQMAAIVKNNIRIMISSGNSESALKALNELKALVPYDSELPEIEKEIQQRNGII